jgi:hypothetical protein
MGSGVSVGCGVSVGVGGSVGSAVAVGSTVGVDATGGGTVTVASTVGVGSASWLKQLATDQSIEESLEGKDIHWSHSCVISEKNHFLRLAGQDLVLARQ